MSAWILHGTIWILAAVALVLEALLDMPDARRGLPVDQDQRAVLPLGQEVVGPGEDRRQALEARYRALDREGG